MQTLAWLAVHERCKDKPDCKQEKLSVHHETHTDCGLGVSVVRYSCSQQVTKTHKYLQLDCELSNSTLSLEHPNRNTSCALICLRTSTRAGSVMEREMEKEIVRMTSPTSFGSVQLNQLLITVEAIKMSTSTPLKSAPMVNPKLKLRTWGGNAGVPLPLSHAIGTESRGPEAGAGVPN